MNFLSEIDDRKESEEGRIFQNKCALVSSQNHRMKKEEGATVNVFVGHFVPNLFSAGRFVTGRTGKQRLLQTIGRDSLNTTNVLPSRIETRFSIIWLTLQNRWTNEQKNAAESDRKIRLKHKNVKMTQITTVHSLFLGWMYIQRNSNSLGEPCCS